MKKAMLVIRKESDFIDSSEKAFEYCKQNNLQLKSTYRVDIEDAINHSDLVMDKIKSMEVDTILSDDILFLISEKASDKSLLTRLEEANIECKEITSGMDVRYIVDQVGKNVIDNLMNRFQNHVPVLVLYEGTHDFRKDADFQNIMKFIHEHLNEEMIDVAVYPYEDKRMVNDVLDTIGKETPDFIILRKNIELEEVKNILDILQKDIGVKVIDMDTINQELMQDKEININFILN